MMKNISRHILNFIDLIDNLIQKVIVGLFSVMLLVLLMQVILRYIFNFSFSWSAELSRYLLVWIVFLAGGTGLVTGEHMSIDLIKNKLPDKLRRTVNFFLHLVLLFFVLFIAKQGFSILAKVSNQTSPALRIPMSYPYAGVPIGAIVMSFYIIKVIITKDFISKKEKIGG